MNPLNQWWTVQRENLNLKWKIKDLMTKNQLLTHLGQNPHSKTWNDTEYTGWSNTVRDIYLIKLELKMWQKLIWPRFAFICGFIFYLRLLHRFPSRCLMFNSSHNKNRQDYFRNIWTFLHTVTSRLLFWQFQEQDRSEVAGGASAHFHLTPFFNFLNFITL